MSFSKEEVGKLREYHTARMTVSEIAETMKKKKSDVRRELVALGYLPIEKHPEPEESEFLKDFKPVEIKKRPYTRITPAIEKRICELRDQCFSIHQIADKLNISSDETVRKVLKRNGYSTKRGEYHKSKPAQINEEFEDAVNQMIEEAQAKEDAQEMTIKEVFEDIDKRFSGKEKEPASAATDTSPEQDITPVIPDTNDTTEPPKSQALTLTGIKMMMELEAMLGEVFGREAEIIDINADGEHCDIGFAYRDRKYCLLFAEREEVPEYGNDQH
jgi:hypothetical protein